MASELEQLFIKRLLTLISQKGISMRKLSINLGKTPDYIQKVVEFRFFPKLSVWEEICSYFNISFQDFIKPDDNDTYLYSEWIPKIKQLTPEEQKTLLPIIELIIQKH